MAVRHRTYQPHESFVRVATACPEVALGDVTANIRAIRSLYKQAVDRQASLVVLPELSLTGYTLGDMVQQQALLAAAERGLQLLAAATAGQPAALVAGLPLAINNALYNCAAVLAGGKVQGIVPKTHIPNYKEFYEKRWFRSWADQPNTTVAIGASEVPFGTQLLFKLGGAHLGIEICEDLWAMEPPSARLAQAGATIIANPSASPEQIHKSDYRRQLVSQQSARLMAAYLYAGCDASESTTDIVMSGHQLIAENGVIVQERGPLSQGQRLTIADIDIDHLLNDRRRDTNIANPPQVMAIIDCRIEPKQTDLLEKPNTAPLVPAEPAILRSVLDIQRQGLVTRLHNSGIKTLVLGLSGGLDSTLALLIAAEAAAQLGARPGELIQTLTLPAAASSKHTQDNAARLAKALGIPNERIDISRLAKDQLKTLGHDGSTQDIVYENVQARIRTNLLLNRANQVHGLVLGTGDLSEIALGWCTFGGDHLSHYNVNASIPKTLVRRLAAYLTEQPAYAKARPVLQSILDTPISPELTSTKNGKISQHTEDIIGPYELHDFFLYYLVRRNDTPEKIRYLAEQAFEGHYTPAQIATWLNEFLKRFMSSQWKRSVAMDGPKVGSVSLSPRGDWRAPSDMSSYPAVPQ